MGPWGGAQREFQGKGAAPAPGTSSLLAEPPPKQTGDYRRKAQMLAHVASEEAFPRADGPRVFGGRQTGVGF